jgi:L-fuculose-phosphate aldolase
MDKKEWDLRKDLCEASHRLYLAGFMAGSDGNLSTILDEHEILITPSRLSKGYLEPHQIVKIDRQGVQISGDLPPSVESPMHLVTYQERPDVCSVVHCHPPILVAFTVAGRELPSSVLPEIETIFGGEIPLVPYATPGGPELAESIRPFICKKSLNVILLDHHGVLAVGQDIYQAEIKVEHAEAAAKVIFYARQMGGEKPLSPESMEKIHAVRQKIVELESRVYSGYCHAPECDVMSPTVASQQTPAPNSIVSDQDLENTVREIIKNYQSGRK